jgi:hypothetical protein
MADEPNYDDFWGYGESDAGTAGDAAEPSDEAYARATELISSTDY